MAAKITVRGRGVVAGRPDGVELAMEVTALESTLEAALDAITERSGRVDRILDEVGVQEEARTTSGIWLGEEHDWEEERRVFRGHRARNRYLLRLLDPSVLGRLMRDVSREGMATIDGPWWKIDPENEARVEACRRAASNARRKAEVYAKSLGLRLGAIERVKEPRVGSSLGPVPGAGYVRAASAALRDAEIEVHPGALEVEAAIDVTYFLEQG